MRNNLFGDFLWYVELIILSIFTAAYLVMLNFALRTVLGIWHTPYLERIPAVGFIVGGSYGLLCLWWLVLKSQRSPNSLEKLADIPVVVRGGLVSGVVLSVFLLCWLFYTSSLYDQIIGAIVATALLAIMLHALIKVLKITR